MAGQKHSWPDVFGRNTDSLNVSHESEIPWNYNVGVHLASGSISKTSRAVVHVSVCEVCFRWRIYNILSTSAVWPAYAIPDQRKIRPVGSCDIINGRQIRSFRKMKRFVVKVQYVARSKRPKDHSFGSSNLLVLNAVALKASMYRSFTLPSSSTVKPAAVEPKAARQ